MAVLALMDAVTRASMPFDDSARMAVHALASPALTAFFQWETWLGSVVVLISICAAAAIWLRRTRVTVLVFAAFAGAYALTEATKAIVRRPRPVPFFSPPLDTWSFPSGHSLESAAVYWTIAAVIAARASLPGRRKIAGFVALLPLITGLSRVYLGVHYPTDVIAGWTAGGCWSAAVVAALRVE